MIKYKIIPNIKTEQLVEFCVSVLTEYKISELPILKLGERQTLFRDDTTTISLKCDGEHQGQFIVKKQLGEFLMLSSSAKFEY